LSFHFLLAVVCRRSTDGGGRGMTFEFDYVFGSDANTELVYNRLGSTIVHGTLEGYNGFVHVPHH
jgi:hypothetical protein